MELQQLKMPYFAPSPVGYSTFRESADTIVPDTFPDIGRIACAEGTVTVKDEVVQNDRVLVSGTVQVNLLYQPENGNGLRKLSVPISFAHIEEKKGITPSCKCHVQCKLASLEAKAVNSRKVTATAQLCMTMTLYAPQQLALTTGIENAPESLQQQYTALTLPLVTHVTPCDFTVLDDIEVTGGRYLEILQAQAVATCTEYQAVAERIVLKGEITLEALGLDDDDHLQTLQQQVRFSQIVDLPESLEDLPLQVHLAVHHVDCMMNGEGLLAIGIGVRALLVAQQTKQLQILQDFYDVDRQSQSTTAQVTARIAGEWQMVQDEIAIALPCIRPATEVVRTIAVCTATKETEQGKWSVMLQAQATCAEEQGAPWSVNRSYQCAVALPQLTAGSQLAQVQLVPVQAQISGEEITVRMQLQAQAQSNPALQIENITAVQDLGERSPSERAVTLLLAYVQQEQSLWNIAKKHASTVQQIRIANGLEAGANSVQDCMLLIPICAG